MWYDDAAACPPLSFIHTSDETLEEIFQATESSSSAAIQNSWTRLSI